MDKNERSFKIELITSLLRTLTRGDNSVLSLTKYAFTFMPDKNIQALYENLSRVVLVIERLQEDETFTLSFKSFMDKQNDR